KTRLIPAIGINGAYKVHIQLLKHTLNIASKIKDIDFQLHHTSVHNNQWLTSLAKENNISTKIQNGNDLGERMYRATHLCLKKYSQCLIIGIDCPELSEQYLIEANQQLTSGYDAVIGPAYDGGYVLIGINNAKKEIFSDIDWGKSTVFTSTINIFNKLNLKYKILSTLHDVDTKEDLQYLKFLPDH
ncbi:MAG: TIGR04282 family arsenosugar biosynthesis glycosyltransferase, partial [Thiohalomonadales bacterium]